MKFAFTPFDKAIVAAVLAPLISLGTTYLNGGELDQKTIIAAVVAAVVAGLGVYFKANAAPVVKPAAPAVVPGP